MGKVNHPTNVSALESFKIPPDGLGSEIVEATFNNETLQFNRQNGEHGKVKKKTWPYHYAFHKPEMGGCISQTINGGAATHPWKCIVVLFDQPAALLFVQSVTLPIAAIILKIQPLVGNLKPFEV